ncbi:MAG: Dipeptidyl aminopeptidase BI [Bryobacteraceae bacterium]|nr:Dipeptidyl aminopeptidase BI [Bryobacteraceae bacterium]
MRLPKQITQHGQTRVDDYFWLRGGDPAAIRAYLDAENAYTEAMLKPAEALRSRLYEEILGRVEQNDASAPVPLRGYLYYSRTLDGKAYPLYCRRKGSMDAPEEILLDLNELAKDEKYLRLGNFRVSPDQRMLAYSLDVSGEEIYVTRVKDLETGALLPDRLENTYYGLEWTNDGRNLIYVTLDEAKRPYQAWLHRLGEAAQSGRLLYEEPDERFHLTLHKSRSKRFLFLDLDSAGTSEVWYAEAAGAGLEPRLFAARRHNIEYDIAHQGDNFLVRTTEGGRNFRVLTAPISDPLPENWKEKIAHREDVLVESVDAFERHLVITERENGLRRLRIENLDGDTHFVQMPETVYTLSPGENPEYETSTLRFHYTSLVTPMTAYDYHMDTRERTLVKQEPVRGGYNPSLYETVRVFAPSPDGVKVPVSMVYRKDLRRDDGNPTLLYGYGSYGISIDPAFSSSRLSLLDRGYIYAIAHIRGGEDLGKRWHDDGKLLKKWNTFDDFIAAAEFLIAAKYASPRKLAITGGSAGGMLMGVVINRKPELFRAVIAKVPFVDVLNTATDPSLPLTVIEYDEWGNSNQRDFWEYIRSYSPYDNVSRQAYPNMLVTAGLNDPRVSYWEPAKWVAKLRALKTDHNLLLLKTNMDAGHGGASGRYERIRETALDYAFLLTVVGGA